MLRELDSAEIDRVLRLERVALLTALSTGRRSAVTYVYDENGIRVSPAPAASEASPEVRLEVDRHEGATVGQVIICWGVIEKDVDCHLFRVTHQRGFGTAAGPPASPWGLH